MQIPDINQRIEEIRYAKNLNNTKFAEKLGITPQYYYDISKKGKSVSATIIKALVEEFKVDANWLLTGKGVMFYSETSGVFEDEQRKEDDKKRISDLEKINAQYEEVLNLVRVAFGKVLEKKEES